MDVGCAADCVDTWLRGCIRGTWGDSSQCYPWSLVNSWIRMKLYTYLMFIGTCVIVIVEE